MTAYAEFKSQANENVVYVDYYNVEVDEVELYFNINSEYTENNQGLIGVKWAKYYVGYSFSVIPGGSLLPNSGSSSMWIKCTSNAVTSNSGNKTLK